MDLLLKHNRLRDTSLSHCLKQNKQGRWVIYNPKEPMQPVFIYEKDLVVAAATVTNFLNGGTNITQEKLVECLSLAVWFEE